MLDDIYNEANVKWVVADIGLAGDPPDLNAFDRFDLPEYFKIAQRYDRMWNTKNEVLEMEKMHDVSLKSLADVDRLLDDNIASMYESGRLVAVKSAMAYFPGSLAIGEYRPEEARKIFENRVLKGSDVSAPNALTDYFFHGSVRRATDLGIPIQIHTGIIAGHFSDINKTNPMLLTEILSQYRKSKFVLMHGSWPFSEMAGAIAMIHPNVHLEMSCGWNLYPAQMEKALDEWLSIMPCSRILAFGSDLGGIPFAQLGSAQRARHGIARVLEDKISKGVFSFDTAKFVAKRIMHENGREVFLNNQ
jgi:hypothetical protein